MALSNATTKSGDTYQSHEQQFPWSSIHNQDQYLVASQFFRHKKNTWKMNEWIYAWVGGWVNEWINEWMNGWVGGWVNEWMNEWVGGWMSEWMNGWMNGWMKNEWMDGWKKERVNEWREGERKRERTKVILEKAEKLGIRRISVFLEEPLSDQNKINAINTFAPSILTFLMPALYFSHKDLNEVELKIKCLLTKKWARHPQHLNTLLYASRL